ASRSGTRIQWCHAITQPEVVEVRAEVARRIRTIGTIVTVRGKCVVVRAAAAPRARVVAELASANDPPPPRAAATDAARHDAHCDDRARLRRRAPVRRP